MNPSISETEDPDQPDDVTAVDDAAVDSSAPTAQADDLDADPVAGAAADSAASEGEVSEGELSEGDVTEGDAEAGDTEDDEGEDGLSKADLLEREGEVAADYLEGLLDIVDADGDIDMDVEGQRAVVSIVGERLRHLVGPGGAVLDALQELTRLAVARETGVRSRLMLDVGGHRARRRTELTELGSKAAQQAIDEGEPVRLAPMTAFERKVVHDAVAAAGLRSESEGVDPQRFVVVLPDGASKRSDQPDAVASTTSS